MSRVSFGLGSFAWDGMVMDGLDDVEHEYDDDPGSTASIVGVKSICLAVVLEGEITISLE